MDGPGDVEAYPPNLAGLDEPSLSGWIATHLPEVTPPLTFTLVAGGRSNLTYRVQDQAGVSYALRRPPISHVLPTAHDMAREYRLLAALGPTPVPVPATYGLCQDSSVTGSPFYLMAFVEGHVVRDSADAASALDPQGRRTAAFDLIDTLAALHAVDIDAVGLGDLGPREDYIARQVRRWTRQYREMALPDIDHGTLVEDVGAALTAAVPRSQGTCLVHGDYRLDNVVVDDQGRILAVLDWEICALGDPLADVGQLLDGWIESELEDRYVWTDPATTATGFPTRDELLARYAEASGRHVGEIGFYRAFGYWKVACILHGVYARYRAGAAAGDQSSVEHFPDIVGRLIRAAATILEEG